MNERLKKIRTDIKLTQKQMSEKIGVTEATVSRMESGKSSITEQTIKMLCNEFNINETWLRTGEGEMYVVSEQDEELAEALAEISLSDNEKLKKIVQKLTKLNDKEIDTINDLIDLLLDRLSNN